ncbi:MAG: MgtC/SapB family protein [Bryobacteraceae bacterium]
METGISLSMAVESLAGAVLIGLLIGGQREAAHRDAGHTETRVVTMPGLRDFLIIALAGGVCGFLGTAWLTAPVLISITALLALFHFEDRLQRRGITTELTGVTTFALSYLAASPSPSFAEPVAIAVTLLVVVFLEAKQHIEKLLRETISTTEFNATLAFVGVVVVIYPLLPAGAYGPYAFFEPRQIWKFVILISSLSYVGYFLEKFLGEETGLFYTSVLGGLASTTAATLLFARESKERPQDTFGLWRAFVIANTVQFPRTLVIVILVSPELARACVWPLTAMLMCGVLLAEILRRWPHKLIDAVPMAAGNPFRIGPALRFGVMFAAVVFLSKWAADKLGTGAFYWTSLLGGLVDVSTVIAPAADLLSKHTLPLAAAEIAVLLALAANAVQKILVAIAAGTREFAWRVTAVFARS